MHTVFSLTTILALESLLISIMFGFSAYLLMLLVSDTLSVPFVRTNKKYVPRIIEALKIGPTDIVYELGCGDGKFLFACAKRQPQATYIGIEKNPALYVWARFKKVLHGNPKNIIFRREDFFTADLTGATRVYTYLLPKLMDALLPKFEKELAPNARIVSSSFEFKQKQPIETIKMSDKKGFYGQQFVYVYEF